MFSCRIYLFYFQLILNNLTLEILNKKINLSNINFFIDTASLEQIKEAYALGVLDGVTTNPSLMAKEGITVAANILQHYMDIGELVDGDVSAEVIVYN